MAMQHATLSSIGLLIACSLFVGCAHTVRVKAVDSRTGQPLAGVSAVWREDASDLLWGSHHFGPTNLPPSEADGTITVTGVRSKRVSRFIFERSGYSTVYVLYSGRTFTRADSASIPGSDGQFILREPLCSVQPTNGFVVIEMMPR